MLNSDKKSFKELFDGICEYYQKEKMNKMALQIYFESLKEFDFSLISNAVMIHVRDPQQGMYFPKVAHIINFINGKPPTPDEIVALAKTKKTPLGIMARIIIGSYDLDNQNAFYLKQRAEEVLLYLPEWTARARNGDYTQHEIARMVYHGVSPCEPFYEGLPNPSSEVSAKLESRIMTLPPPDDVEDDLEIDFEGVERVTKMIKQII